MSMIHIGIDPGGSGGIAVIHGRNVFTCALKGTEADVRDFLDAYSQTDGFPSTAILERVGAMPKQGLASTFKFGQSFGFLRGLLIALRIRFEMVTPPVWQKAMGIPAKKGEGKTAHKNRTKARAQELFPQFKITHAIADALLLAEFCRRWEVGA